MQESLEAREKEEDVGYEGAYDEEKTLVCMNILKTIDQLVSSLESAPASLDKVEAIIAPALEFTVRSNLVGESALFGKTGIAEADDGVPQSSTTKSLRSSIHCRSSKRRSRPSCGLSSRRRTSRSRETHRTTSAVRRFSPRTASGH